MKIKTIPKKKLSDLEKEVGSEVVVTERQPRLRESMNLKRFYATFPNVESKEGGLLVHYSGDGNTTKQAIEDYCEQISHRILVINSYTPQRRELITHKIIYK